MIPRTLVPIGARLPAEDVATTRRRPSTLDERTLVPSNLPIVKLDGQSTIPTNLPLESIATRVVVPRDVNVEAVQRPEESNLPLQPTDMDERVTVPQGAAPPEEFSPLPPVSEELVEPDIIQTGEVAFLTPERPSQGSFGDAITRIVSITAAHLAGAVPGFRAENLRAARAYEGGRGHRAATNHGSFAARCVGIVEALAKDSARAP